MRIETDQIEEQKQPEQQRCINRFQNGSIPFNSPSETMEQANE